MSNNYNNRRHHKNNNDSDNLKKFSLGNCEAEGKKYEFRYNQGTYSIILFTGEETFDEILSTKEKENAYVEWNKIKRPEKKVKA